MLMMNGILSRKVKETIAILISKDNSCRYCVMGHTLLFQAIGVSEDEMLAISEDL
jgi:AhpD family alkylhydroperoxidase